jgi:hypothetical protein
MPSRGVLFFPRLCPKLHSAFLYIWQRPQLSLLVR